MTKFDKAMMQTALIWKDLSYGRKKKVGAVIARDNRIISHGYNGNISGGSNQLENHEGQTTPCVIHAEENALIFCAKEGIACKNTVIYVTCLPCSHCAALIIQAGISGVFYLDWYSGSRGDGESLLQTKDIDLIQLKI